jgi:hypothetical protein
VAGRKYKNKNRWKSKNGGRKYGVGKMSKWSKEQQEEFDRQVAEHDAEVADSDDEGQQFEIAPADED